MKDWCVICNETDMVETVARCVKSKMNGCPVEFLLLGCSEVMKSGLLGRQNSRPSR
jgi:hypothetical protein